MALINCGECGKEVSTEAQSCPHCGYKKRGRSILTILIAVIFVVVVLPIIGLMIKDNLRSPEAKAAEYTQAAEECADIGSKIIIPGYGTGSGDKAIAAMEDCMSKHGYPVNLRK